MKKTLLLVLIITLVLSLGSCTNDNNNNNGSDSPTNADNQNIMICKHDIPEKISRIEANDATCTATGLTEGFKCDTCGVIVVPQTVVPTIECTESAWMQDVAPNVEREGLFHTECTICGKILNQKVVPACEESEGLGYVDNKDGTVTIVGMGSCTDINIVIPNNIDGKNVVAIKAAAFAQQKTIRNIIIPNSIKSIGDFAFAYSAVQEIIILDGMTEIGDYAFYYCEDLKSIVIPDSVQSLGDYAFENCSELESIHVPYGVTRIGAHTFMYCQFESIVIPETVTTIGEQAFQHTGLIDVILPEGVTTIEFRAFSTSYAIINISIPSTVSYIGSWAFAHNSTIKKITYNGTIDQWNNLCKENNWDEGSNNYTLHCLDGTISADGTVTYN